jgi:ParB family transcriptional regulator, chromosome partitioning protein
MLDLSRLEQLDLVPPLSAGGPLMVPIADIDEDPDQPRVEFDDEPLKELAATIAERGVRSPVSVRPHPRDPGRWVLNYGARRLRASKLIGLSEIPAFVDKATDSYDQVIENEQREGLKPLELALFVKRELGKGVSQAEIARRLGKSQTYITFVRAMIDPPSWLMEVYSSGKCRNAAQLYELRRLHEADAAGVEKRLDSPHRIGRGDIDRLKKSGDISDGAPIPKLLPSPNSTMEPTSHDLPSSRKRSAVQDRPKNGLILTAKYNGRRVRVELGAVPSKISAVYVTSASKMGQKVAEVNALTELELVRSAQ